MRPSIVGGDTLLSALCWGGPDGVGTAGSAIRVGRDAGSEALKRPRMRPARCQGPLACVATSVAA